MADGFVGQVQAFVQRYAHERVFEHRPCLRSGLLQVEMQGGIRFIPVRTFCAVIFEGAEAGNQFHKMAGTFAIDSV